MVSSVSAYAGPSLQVSAFGKDGFGVGGATVQITQSDTSALNATTDSLGNANFSSILPGNFSVKVSATGYPDYIYQNDQDVIQSGSDSYQFSASLASVPNDGPVTKVLSSMTATLSSIPELLTQYTSTKWPNLATVCSNRFPNSGQWPYADLITAVCEANL